MRFYAEMSDDVSLQGRGVIDGQGAGRAAAQRLRGATYLGTVHPWGAEACWQPLRAGLR